MQSALATRNRARPTNRPFLGTYSDNNLGIYDPSIYTPGSAYILSGLLFRTSLRLQTWLASYRRTARRRRPRHKWQTNVYEWFWWATLGAVLVEPGLQTADARRGAPARVALTAYSMSNGDDYKRESSRR